MQDLLPTYRGRLHEEQAASLAAISTLCEEVKTDLSSKTAPRKLPRVLKHIVSGNHRTKIVTSTIVAASFFLALLQREHLDLKYDLPASVAQAVTDAVLDDQVLFGTDATLLSKIFTSLSELLSRLSDCGMQVRILL